MSRKNRQKTRKQPMTQRVTPAESTALVLKGPATPQSLSDRQQVWDSSSTAVVAKRGNGIIGLRNARLLRTWAKNSAFIRAAINHRKSQVAMAKWDIVPVDPEKPFDDDAKLALMTLLHNPNDMRDSFRSLMEKMLEDELVLDAGVLEKELNRSGIPVALYNMDAAEIRVSETWDGSDPKEARYIWYRDNKIQASYTNDEMIYVINNPSTHSVIGLSPLEVLQDTIEAEFDAMRFNASMVRQTAPPGIINLGEGMGAAQVERFKTYWEAEVAGQAAVAILGGSKGVQFIPMGASQKEMLFQEWIDYLCRKIASVFGISPQDIGIVFDVNRSTAQVQQEISEDRGLRTLLTNNEEYFNRELVADFRRAMARKKLYSGEITAKQYMLSETLNNIPSRQIYDVLSGPQKASSTGQGQFYRTLVENDPLNLMFSFVELNRRDMATIINLQTQRLAGMPTMTINEARQEQGKDPVEGGDEILVDQGGNKVPLSMIKKMAENSAKAAENLANGGGPMAPGGAPGNNKDDKKKPQNGSEGPGVETGAHGSGAGSGSANKPKNSAEASVDGEA